MGIFLYLVGWAITILFGLNAIVTLTAVESAFQQTVLWLMIIAAVLGLVVAGLGAVVTALTDVKAEIKTGNDGSRQRSA